MLKTLRVLFLFACLLFFTALLAGNYELVRARLRQCAADVVLPLAPRNRLAQPGANTGSRTLSIALRPPVELDFLGKEEVFRLRSEEVGRHAHLVAAEYKPYDPVFGQIVGGQPWWGVEGIYFYGPGMQAIAGPAEESRFLLNPFLLVGLLETNARIISGARIVDSYPQPFQLAIDLSGRRGEARYDLSSYLAYLNRNRLHGGKDNLSLCAYNARDFGFDYLWIDEEHSNGIVAARPSSSAVRILQFIHGSGSSCGYPGGCNNASPDQPELEVVIRDYPAAIEIKLWEEEPVRVTDPADFVFVIHALRGQGQTAASGPQALPPVVCSGRGCLQRIGQSAK